MTTLKESALSYEAKQMKNIADLETVPVNCDMITKKFKEGTADEFEAHLIVVGGEEYRVPESVLKSLKQHIEARPDLASFKVTKTGTGMNTQYTVIPL